METAAQGKVKSSILIVDDTPANLRLLVDILEEQGLAVAVAQDGEEALQRAEFIRPDLILLDVVMPGIDGFETCRRLKRHELLRDIPVIFMTVHDSQEDKLLGFAVGGVDYVTKPLQIEEVRARINNQLALRTAQVELQAKNSRLQDLIKIHQESELALNRACHDLSESEDRYRKLVDLLPQAILVHTQGNIVFANAGAAHLFGARSPKHLLGSSIMKSVPEEFLNTMQRRMHLETEERQETAPMVLQVLRADGTPVNVEVSSVPIQYGHVPAVMVILRDITEQREHEAALVYQATHDLLTGLPNRALLCDRLIQAISRAERYRGSVGIMFVDLDKFKYINDSLGHGAGDELLCTMAQRLKACVRECDSVARLGGDEFVVLVEPISSEAMLPMLAQRIVATVSEPITLKEQTHSITCSIGVSSFPRDGRDADELLKRADLAMYRAKESGRNNFQSFMPQMQTRLDDFLQLEKRLRQALERDEFLLHFQPQVALQTGQIIGLEALIRWQSPEFGLTLPSQFIPQAEESNLILAIGEWVLHSACTQLKAWQRAGLPHLPVAVNISASQLEQKHFARLVQGVLQTTHLEAKYLELELAESQSMRDPEKSIAQMQSLKAIGVSLAIDDFGTGYSNLSYLKRSPVDKLKVDQSFVKGLTNDAQDYSIVMTVIRLARSLGLRVIAEGVETEGQLRLLAVEGCDEIQGHYFSPPLPAADITTLLQQQPRLDLAHTTRTQYKQTILLVDDDPAELTKLQYALQGEGVAVLTARSAEEAHEILAQREVGVVISDQHMPGEDGIDLFARIKQMFPRIVRILLTADVTSTTLVNAINRGEIYRFIIKPWDAKDLREMSREALLRYEHY
jgi:diguanylate cyclase (GGDEF)-like protein/PAS domain S-box-containing protein